MYCMKNFVMFSKSVIYMTFRISKESFAYTFVSIFPGIVLNQTVKYMSVRFRHEKWKVNL